MQDDESRVHETVKTVYPYETGEGAICDVVRAAVKADLAEKFPSGHTGCLSTAVVETPRMPLPLRKAERSTGWYILATMRCLPAFPVSACRWNGRHINAVAGRD